MSLQALAWATGIMPGSPAEKLTLIALADRHNIDTGRAYPSIASLCEFTGLHRRTVMSCLQKLEAGGWIFDSGERVGKTGQVKVYHLNLDRPSSAKEGANVHPSNRAQKSPKECTKPPTEPSKEPNTPLPPQLRVRRAREALRRSRVKPVVEPLPTIIEGEPAEAIIFRDHVQRALGSDTYSNLFRHVAVGIEDGGLVLVASSAIVRDRLREGYRAELGQAMRAAVGGGGLRIVSQSSPVRQCPNGSAGWGARQ